MFSSWKTAGFIAILWPIIGIMLIDSVPAPIIRSASPRRMRSAASATACTPDEQKRLMVIAPMPFGRPASSMPMRATFMPCSASGIAQPTMMSSMRERSSCGSGSRMPRRLCASRSSGRVFLNTPRGALPTGVRFAATM